MKALIFSDSHGRLATMLDLVEKERPDEVFHLGDCLKDAEALAYAYPDLPVSMVPGNCDGWTGKPEQMMLERCGVRILFSHGHIWRVKGGPERAVAAARGQGAHILLYGHTHIPQCRAMGGLWLCNPGTVGGIGGEATYGCLTMTSGTGEFCLEVHSC